MYNALETIIVQVVRNSRTQPVKKISAAQLVDAITGSETDEETVKVSNVAVAVNDCGCAGGLNTSGMCSGQAGEKHATQMCVCCHVVVCAFNHEYSLS